MCRLIPNGPNPPGNFFFPKDGGGHFGPHPMIEALANEMLAYRKSNNKPRATLEQCLLDAEYYQCQRLGCMKAYCYETNSKVRTVSPHVVLQPSTGCRGCGMPMAA